MKNVIAALPWSNEPGARPNCGPNSHRVYSDSIGDIIRELTESGQIDQLKAVLFREDRAPRLELAKFLRDIAYELASEPNKHLAVDVLLYASGIEPDAQQSLRDYATKHGCSHEAFRARVLTMKQRLGHMILDALPSLDSHVD
jgi:hypothetical protein